MDTEKYDTTMKYNTSEKRSDIKTLIENLENLHRIAKNIHVEYDKKNNLLSANLKDYKAFREK